MAKNKRYENTPGVVWHIDVIPALEKFSPDMQARFLMESLYYRRDGTEPDFCDDPLADMFWTLYRPRMDYDEAGYYDTVSEGRLGGMYRAYKQSETAKGREPLSFSLWKEAIASKDDTTGNNSLEAP